MSAQDYGDLSDYLVNGDNFTCVQNCPGQSLTIPGQQGILPVVPDIVRDTYRPLGGDTATCDVGNCALIAHDATTGLFVILKVASFDQLEEDCTCALAGVFLQPGANCRAILQQFVDDSQGQSLFDVFNEWVLEELGLLAQEFTASVFFDYWFTGCYGDIITIPNLLNPVIPVQPPPPPPPPGQPPPGSCVSYSFWGKGCVVRV